MTIIVDILTSNVPQISPMNEEILDKTLNVRLSMPVFMRLREIARMEDLKIADLIRRAIRKTYGLPKK